ncbi:MAG: hydrogenase maturation protease [Acidobacteriota bacterium]|nr:hydrogenase maturation protease [Acidobacteriota bacterium]
MKTLVAGFGNLLLGDDGFGVEVIRRFVARGVPESVEVVEVGIGGFDFVLKLMDGFDRVVIVDLVQRGGRPGTVTAFTPCAEDTTLRPGDSIDPHIAEPTRAMKLARQLNVLPAAVTVVGCEPARCDVGIGLTPQVAEGVERALDVIDRALTPCLSSN